MPVMSNISSWLFEELKSLGARVRSDAVDLTRNELATMKDEVQDWKRHEDEQDKSIWLQRR